MFSFVTLGTNDLKKSKIFYDELLKSINSGGAGVEYRAGGGQIGGGKRTVFANFNNLNPYDTKSINNYEDNKDKNTYDKISTNHECTKGFNNLPCRTSSIMPLT